MNRLGYGRTTTAVLAVTFLAFAFAPPQITHGGDMSACIASGAVVDTNDANQAIFPWGHPQFTDGGANVYPRPAWVSAACKDGGLWITNDTWYGWQPSLGDWTPDLATNRLLIQLDRALVSSNLWIAVAGTGETNATLLAGFYDNELLAVAEPVTLHVAATAKCPAMSAPVVSEVEPFEWFTNNLNLSQTPSASIIALSATEGQMRIFCSVLCPDSAATEANLGTPVVPPAQETPLAPTAPAPSVSTNGTDWATTTAPVPQAPQAFPLARSGPRIWYVDRAAGDDLLHDGTAEIHVPSTSIGPKRTVAAALTHAARGDTISVARGVYPERVHLDGVRLIANGRVVLQ